MRVKQEIFISEAKKLQDYLVVPNKLLLSLSRNTGLKSLLLFLNYIRAREAGNSNKQRAQPSSLCSATRALRIKLAREI